ncbi:LPXTG cell wall anchor domain-containing protein [Brevibacterium ravenspurgense]|uniref:LPXTG cell wall anchor domain-containing protein n=1 Tax=Brevibacterium ravenspurgense TaxID=479117 RepID=UPI0002EBA1DF|nr:LPXTG cell wall anchor domain-containing protein [Brevibacterium ravenspurgense]
MPRSQRFGAFVLAAAVIGTLTPSTAVFAALPATQQAPSEEPAKDTSASEPSEEPKPSEAAEAPASPTSEPSEDPKTPEAPASPEAPATPTSEPSETPEAEEEAKTGKVDFRLYRDKNLNNTYDDEDSHDGYVNLLNKDTGEWFKVLPGSLQKQGLPAGTYTVYMRDASVADGFGAVVDAKGKRLPFAELKEQNDATYIDEDNGETAETVTDTGRFVTTTIEVKAGETVTAHFASSRIDASAKVTLDGENVPTDVYFKDGNRKLKSFESDSGYLASADPAKKTRHFFTGEWITVGVNPVAGQRVKGVTVGGMGAGKDVKAERVSPFEYRVKRSEMGDDFGRFEFKVELEKTAEFGKVDFRLFRDENLNNQHDGEGEDVHYGYVNLKNQKTGEWFKVMPGSLQKHGLPAGTYKVYMRNNSIADGYGVVVDSKGKRLPFEKLEGKNEAVYIDEDNGKQTGTVTDEGRFVTTTIEVKAGETVEAHYASTRIDAAAKVTLNGEKAATDVYFKDGNRKLKSFESGSGYLASADPAKKTRHFFSEEWITLGVKPVAGQRVKGVTVGGMGAGKTVEAERVSPFEYRVKRSEMGDDFGRFEFKVELEKTAEFGKVDFRLFRDENLNNTYDSGTDEDLDDYVNLFNEDTKEWFKVLPGSLQKQGLPAGKYTVYMRTQGTAQGFGAIVDADGKRLPFKTLEGKNEAVYIDEDNGKQTGTVTDTGRFVSTTIEVKAGETVTAHYASSRIDASAKINDDGVESVYFKDGDTKLGAFASDAGFLATADAEKKIRHFFTEDTVTLGVNLKDGRRVVKVEVEPSATRGGETRVLYEADASARSADPEATPAAAPIAFAAASAAEASAEQDPTEFSIKRSEMGDDFGRFEFVVTTGPKEDPTDEPTDEPTDDPTDEPTDEPTQDPTDEPTDGSTEGGSAAPAPGEPDGNGSTGGSTESGSGSTTGSASDSSSSQKGSLPRTGVSVGMSLAAGLGLIAVGSLLVARRRKG